MPLEAEILDESRMKQIFEPMEGIETNKSIYACLRVVIFINVQGFYDILLHLESWLRASKQRMCNSHMVHFVLLCEDKFLEPSIGTSYMV